MLVVNDVESSDGPAGSSDERLAELLNQLSDDLRDDPRYYLRHFQFVIAWVCHRYIDLLGEEEHTFIARFTALPEPSQALLVRMVSRKGELFRPELFSYPEVGDIAVAIQGLESAGLIELDPGIDLDELFSLLRVPELRHAFAQQIADQGLPGSITKLRLREALADLEGYDRPMSEWWPAFNEPLIRLTVMPVCNRLRLMFFGNLQQSWSDFVLAELGISRFEKVALDVGSRAFQQRTDVDIYLALHRLRERLEEGEPVAALWAGLPIVPEGNIWLEARRARLLYRMGQQAQRDGEEPLALECYALAGKGEPRIRRMRLMERRGDYQQAFEVACDAVLKPADESERQALERLVPRLCKRLGKPVLSALVREAVPPTLTRVARLPISSLHDSGSVEAAVCQQMGSQKAPLFYVENALISGLFGLLCWEAIFAPLPGAFFHPFHHAPADLRQPDFVSRRRPLFDTALRMLDDGRYRDIILARWRDKYGIANPFVNWGWLDEELITLALEHVSAEHLKAMCERLLHDPAANRAGLPDLIQFLPDATEGPRYRLIEVKGPGDRLQDNQKRWLAFFSRHAIPAEVCHVQWEET
ncbi:VRR-NUC domain-containing protein [Halomonas binhaiensis]|uniref:phosphodiesterase I n=1 Tax=Halomonas binhaiensis TaxID=2562282 RepID=A0A5C1NIX2_9GAMM|nr:VRR-NUC domain-containing protein [Halomonas binhaiensis]